MVDVQQVHDDCRHCNRVQGGVRERSKHERVCGSSALQDNTVIVSLWRPGNIAAIKSDVSDTFRFYCSKFLYKAGAIRSSTVHMREKEQAQQSKGNDRLVPTFNLQDQSDGATLVSVLHSHGVVPTVLLLGSDQGQDAHVAAWDNKGITAMTAGSKGQGKVWLSS